MEFIEAWRDYVHKWELNLIYAKHLKNQKLMSVQVSPCPPTSPSDVTSFLTMWPDTWDSSSWVCLQHKYTWAEVCTRHGTWQHHVSCDATWDPAAGLVFRVSYCKYYNHNHGDKQPNLDTGDIRARRRWQTLKTYGFKDNEMILQ